MCVCAGREGKGGRGGDGEEMGMEMGRRWDGDGDGDGEALDSLRGSWRKRGRRMMMMRVRGMRRLRTGGRLGVRGGR